MARLIKKLFHWIFKDELEKLESKLEQAQLAIDCNETQMKRIKNMLDNFDVSVDAHYKSDSWAVICLQGEKSDFIKFVDLGSREIVEIEHFLRRFERGKIDANPSLRRHLKGMFKI